MSVSGVISRQVLPACGSLCFFCPAMRARSRQPVKRYKKLISDIFPHSQDEGPNDRKIGKLCEYANKNPLRIPKITTSLEQRCYKELRNENFQSAKIVMCIYRKLLISCKEQMPLFASSLLSIIQTLLDQTRRDEIQIVGCSTLFDFINNQKDGTHMFNFEGFIPQLCRLAQEVGEDERARSIRSAALQALSALVRFMGEHSHISAEFDNVVSVVLENYGGPKKNTENPDQHRWLQEVCKIEGHVNPLPDALTKVPSLRIIVNDKGEINVTEEDAQNPCFWSRVCLHNMAKLAKEATTIRRILESLFRYLDNENLWSLDNGLAFSVLKDLQILMDNTGQNTHFLLSTMIKHLDHKNVLKQPNMQLDIVSVTTLLAQQTKVEPSVAIIAAVSDVMRHLRKSIHCSLDDENLGAEIKRWNKSFREAVDKCLVQLSDKIGDAGPILDVMAVMLENISTITVIARTTITAVYRAAQIVASMPNLSYQNKAFPEALFHQLLPAMVHPDHETRIGAHQIFSVVLVPSSVHPSTNNSEPKKAMDLPRALSRTVSVFSSSAALFDKLRSDKSLSRENPYQDNKNNVVSEGQPRNNNNGVLNRLKSSYSRVYSVKNPPLSTTDGKSVSNSKKEQDANSLRLSSRQITLLLSSIWAQSISPANSPENFEAIAHTYSLVLLFSRAKNSSHEVLIRSFQLAFSLRNISLTEGESLLPSRRRSLFTLATSMILFSSKAYNILPLVQSSRVTLTEKNVDPFLCLVGDHKLQVIKKEADHPKNVFGSKEDDRLALKFLSEIEITQDQTRESFASEIVNSLENLSDSELCSIKEQLLNEFLPDDVCPLGAQFMDTPNKVYLIDPNHSKSLKETALLFSIEDEGFTDSSESQAKVNTELAVGVPHLLSVNQILESVLETTHQVGRISVSTRPDMPYKEMAGHCEALLMGKQQKMSHLMNAQLRQESLIRVSVQNHEVEAKNVAFPSHVDVGSHAAGNPFLNENLTANLNKSSASTVPTQCAAEYQHNPQFFRLPASSPYDNFLKAAGC
ncbi:uncharacterized protein LOC116129348 [Pistacia vera]|uniref:uncharacterized protein LOC116129348 n=1 Tax=Pistacia vera TaxID=55513 RepID=UPI00126349E3|nr:uncharacterized protein LOC116129348 [Pistacia vera]